MANVAALKKKAADFEQKKQLDKAIALYREVLAAYDAGEDENPDVGLYNRVGDLMVRAGNTPDAVALYERAVDLYADGGFHNNAIALCNKILRTSPGRAIVYYKLGKISAAKGFKGDAKLNFLEYADRMQKSGDIQESFRALKEFADLCPDQDDIRLMLAEQLTKADRKGEALEQLQTLYARYDAEGRTTEAQATAARIKAIDPNAEAKAGSTSSATKRDDLVFLDLDAPTPSPRKSTAVASPIASPVAPPAAPPQLVIEPTVSAAAEAASTIDEPPTAGSMLGLETTSLGDTTEPSPDFASLIIEPAPSVELPFSEPPAPVEELELMDLGVLDEPTSPSADLPFLSMDPPNATVSLDLIDLGPPAGTSDFPVIELEQTSEQPAAGSRSRSITPSALDGLDLVESDEPVFPPPPRRSSVVLAHSVDLLLADLEETPDDHALRRRYAEALLDKGDRDAGLKELDAALAGFEKTGDLDTAGSVADEIIQVNPASVRHHQKRVEFAFRANDKARLVESYLALGGALVNAGQADKAKVVYQRVLEIVPDDIRAVSALEAYGESPATELVAPASPAPRLSQAPRHTPARPTARGRRYTAEEEAEMAAAAPPAAPPPAAPGGDDEYVSLGDWLRDEEGPKSTRMVVGEEEPSGDEAADFADMLKKFKQGVADNVDDEDHESHYDLGVAFKEMGLLDEAIAEFQKALRGAKNRVRTFEALGQCFVDKVQLPVAVTILQRALNEPGTGDEQLIGVLYLLGYVSTELGRINEARGYFERVFAVDIQFRDVGDRLNALDQTPQ